MATHLNNIISTFQTIANDHGQLQRFEHGQLSEVNLAKLDATHFPLLYAEPISANLQRGQITFTLGLLVCDHIQDDETDRTDVWNDTLLILQDVVNEFRHSVSSASNAQNRFVSDAVEVLCTPFTERFDNSLSGWEAQIDVLVGDDNNLCLMP